MEQEPVEQRAMEQWRRERRKRNIGVTRGTVKWTTKAMAKVMGGSRTRATAAERSDTGSRNAPEANEEANTQD